MKYVTYLLTPTKKFFKTYKTQKMIIKSEACLFVRHNSPTINIILKITDINFVFQMEIVQGRWKSLGNKNNDLYLKTLRNFVTCLNKDRITQVNGLTK